MKILETLAAQGEIRAYRIDAIPAQARPLAKDGEHGHHVIGHSETGHHHILMAERAEVYEVDNAPEGMRVLYALLESPGELRHMRPHDTHESLAFGPGTYMFRADREYDHYADLARRVAD